MTPRPGLTRRRAFGTILAGVLAAGALAGCSGPDPSAAEDIAARFVRAVEQKDGAAACRLMTPNARESAGGVAGTPCEEAVLDLDEKGSRVSGSEAWGDAARVEVGVDTVFLRRLDDGWRVSAAGCTPRPTLPYDCDLEA